jgi:hypothetical protein
MVRSTVARGAVGDPMTLHRHDYDQAARYLKYACELLERQAFGRTVTLREVSGVDRKNLRGVYTEASTADQSCVETLISKSELNL